MKYLAIISAVLVVLVGLRLLVPRMGSAVAGGISKVNGTSQLAECPTTPNCQSSESARSEQRVDRFDISQSADEAINTLASIISTYPGVTIIQQSERYLYASFATRLMGYLDDVEFLLSDDQQSIQIRSASRVGKSDLGANANRIDALRAALNGKL